MTIPETLARISELHTGLAHEYRKLAQQAIQQQAQNRDAMQVGILGAEMDAAAATGAVAEALVNLAGEVQRLAGEVAAIRRERQQADAERAADMDDLRRQLAEVRQQLALREPAR